MKKFLRKSLWGVVGVIVSVFLLNSCKTKGEIRREQDLERLKTEVKEARDIKADVDTSLDELKVEVARLKSVSEEQAEAHRTITEDLRNQVLTLQTRIQALEQRAVSEELAVKQPPSTQSPAQTISFEQGKRLFDEGKFEEALEVLREVEKRSSKNGEQAKKTKFLIAEVLFSSKEYASAVLEFSDYRKRYPKDAQVPTAMYRQAWAFKNLGQQNEARLFYRELIDKYPSHPLGLRAKNEVKKLVP